MLTLSYATLGYFEYIFFYWMPHYFREIRHIPKHEAALYAGIVNLSMMALTPIGGWISDRLVLSFSYRFGRRLVPIVGMLLCSALLYLGANTDRVWLFVTSFALAIGCAGATEGPFWVTAIHLGGRDGGTSAGIVNTGGNAGGFLAPIVTPWVAHLTGDWKWGLNLGSIVCLVGLIAWFYIDPEETLDVRESV